MHAFDVLGDPVRRRLLELLADGERTAGALTEIVRAEFGISQPAVSQHLRVLREAGLVSDNKEGTRRVYRIEPDGLLRVREYFDGFWAEALEHFREAAREETG